MSFNEDGASTPDTDIFIDVTTVTDTVSDVANVAEMEVDPVEQSAEPALPPYRRVKPIGIFRTVPTESTSTTHVFSSVGESSSSCGMEVDARTFASPVAGPSRRPDRVEKKKNTIVIDEDYHREGAAEILERARLAARKISIYDQGGFNFHNVIDHIMESYCRHDVGDSQGCLRCVYQTTLNLPELPEMVFPKNFMRISFKGASIEFNALDALKLVCPDHLPDVKVAPSLVWQEARKDRLKTILTGHKPFDWTYTTYYKGTLTNCHAEPTEERIDMERLKRRDTIAFITGGTIFEDEVADHGMSQLSVKLRVMEEGYFFALMRFYLRVDDVMMRVCDTRIVGDNNSNFVLREWQRREAKMQDLLHVNPQRLYDMNSAWMYLPLVEEVVDRIVVDEK